MKKISLCMSVLCLAVVCLLGMTAQSEAAANIHFKLQKVFMQDGQEIIRGTFKNTGDSVGAVTRLCIDVHLDRKGSSFFQDSQDFQDLWIPVGEGEKVTRDFIVVVPENNYEEPGGRYKSHGEWVVHWRNL